MTILRIIIDTSTNIIGKLKENRRLNPKVDKIDGLVKVNLGCGLDVAPGWTNIDASLNALIAGSPRPILQFLYRLSGSNQYRSLENYCDLLSSHKYIHHNLAISIPLKDKTADFVYSSHFLEHLFKEEGANMLKETYRVLKPNGVMRVSVPDLTYAISLYDKGEKIRMLEDFFFLDYKNSFLTRHKYMYDFELLSSLLEEIGFKEIRRCKHQQGITPDIHILDNRPEMSLFIEATK
jgi:SAM-dependent methyltransferase